MDDLAPSPAHVPHRLLDDPSFLRAVQARNFTAVFAMARKNGISYYRIGEACGIKPERISKIARGEATVTALDTIERVSDALRIPGALLGLAARPWEQGRPTPPESDEGDATKRRAALTMLGLSAAGPLTEPAAVPLVVEALRYTADLERTDLGPGTLQQLEEQVALLSAHYAERPAEQAWDTVWELRHHTAALLRGRHTLAQQHQLVVQAGTLSVILGWLAHDRGYPAAALAYANDGHTHGQASHAGELTASADDLAATVHLYAQRPARAAAHAARGLASAPPRSAAQVRLATQSARCHAHTGDAEQFTQDRALAHRASLAFPAHAAGLFSADQIRLLGFDSASYLALEQPTQARLAAEQATAQYAGAPALSPTRAAIAHLDLAAAHSALGNLDAALNSAELALNGPRPADAITSKARALAHTMSTRYRNEQAVQDFTDRVRTLGG